MGACKGITMGALVDCENPLKASVDEKLLVGNLDDIVRVVFNTTNPSVIEDIIMKTGTALHIFHGVRSSNKPEVGFVSDEISVGFNHQVDFSVFEVDSAQKVNLQGLANKKSFAIYQNPKDTSLGDAVWEALGINSGLEMSQLSRLPASKDGSYKIQLKTPDTAAETGLPNSVWDTDIETTEAMLAGITSDGLLRLTSIVGTDASPDITITFEDETGAAAVMANAGNIILGGDSVKAITNIAITGATVVITAATPYASGDNVTVSGEFTSDKGVLTLSNETLTIP